MQQLSILDIETIEGVKTIRSNREKTDSCFIVPLSQKAESILKQYEYKMPQKSNARYNQALKDLANRTGIQKNLTTHVARHTFATILINDNVAINDLSKMLGHNSIRQT